MAISTIANAQTMNIHLKSGQSVEYPVEKVDYIDFSEETEDPPITVGDAVDLGLSVKWASCNVGASKPEEYGYYYAWGETSPKNTYDESNYAFYDYNKQQYIDIGKDISGTQYDAATANLGGDWRMPRESEIDELITKCSWEWTQINGINGYVIKGSNGNSIFLPAAGNCAGTIIGNSAQKYVWYSSSELYEPGFAWCISASSTSIYNLTHEIYRGYPVRAVTSK